MDHKVSGDAIQYIPGLAQLLGLPQLPESQQSLPCGDTPEQAACSWDGELAVLFYFG